LKPFSPQNRIISDEQEMEWITRSVAGDRASFEKLMKSYSRRMYNFIFRMVREEEVAVELSQELFIKLYQVLPKYNREYRFSTWLYRICYNLVIDHVRRHQHAVDSLEDDDRQVFAVVGAEEDPEPPPHGLEPLIQEERRRTVWSMVHALPAKYRELLLLRYAQGQKYEDIAEITGLPVGTVKNRIFKAKGLMRREIEKHELFD